MSEKYRIIGKGQSGWHASSCRIDPNGFVSCKSSLSSYDSSPGELLTIARDAEEGCPVYDASQADSAAFVSWVFSGPMCDVSLPDDACNKFTEDQKRRALAMCGPGGLSGGFDTMVEHAAAEDPAKLGSLDSVGRGIYLAELRKRVPGVRFGRVQSGAVIWEDGTRTEWPKQPKNAPKTDPRIVDCNSLGVAIRDGLVKSDAGATCFLRYDKPIEVALDWNGRSMAGRKYGARPQGWMGSEVLVTLTGRKVFACSGPGSAFECIMADGSFGWFTQIRELKRGEKLGGCHAVR